MSPLCAYTRNFTVLVHSKVIAYSNAVLYCFLANDGSYTPGGYARSILIIGVMHKSCPRVMHENRRLPKKKGQKPKIAKKLAFCIWSQKWGYARGLYTRHHSSSLPGFPKKPRGVFWKSPVPL